MAHYDESPALQCHHFQYLALHYVYPDVSKDVYDNLPHILGAANLFAFFLCTVLLFMGKTRPQSDEKIPKLVVVKFD